MQSFNVGIFSVEAVMMGSAANVPSEPVTVRWQQNEMI